MKILLVKLSSLGDVVHTLPVVHDIRRALPNAQIDWVVEEGLEPLLRRCDGLNRVVPVALRRWRKSWLSAETHSQWRAFKKQLQTTRYDAVIDLQGLTKSALVARQALRTPSGKRYAMANRTDGSSYEAPTRWLADSAIALPVHVHAVERGRLLCASALGYTVQGPAQYGLQTYRRPNAPVTKSVAFIMGSSRMAKCWPALNWRMLAGKLIEDGYCIALLHGSAEEEQACQTLALDLGHNCEVLPRMGLDRVIDALAGCVAAIGVDSGVSHIAVGLGLTHIQIYNRDTAWRTGPQGSERQCSVYIAPTPSVGAVWQAWERIVAAAA